MKRLFGKPVAGDRSSVSLFAALVLAALVPVMCVLWFMNIAMRNERLAVQERMAEIYLNQLVALQRQVNAFWQERQAALLVVAGGSAREEFAAGVRGGLADAVVLYDKSGKVLYPAGVALEAPVEERSEWAAARELEYQKKDFAAAAAAYAKIVEASRDIHANARALQAEAACWLKSGRTSDALARLSQVVGDPTLRHAVSAQGTLIAPNAQLMILKLLDQRGAEAVRLSSDERNAHAFRYDELRQRTLDDLVARLNDYADAKFPATQRRFLMREVKALAPEVALSTLAAEDLAADYLEANAPAPSDTNPATAGKLQRTSLARVWRVASSDRTVIALFREARLKAEMEKLFASAALPDVRVQLLAPDEPFIGSKLVPSVEAGEFLPGWRLGLSFRQGDPFAEAWAQQMRFYLWTGFLVVVVIALLALLVARYVSAQMRLAQLKNELVSTVSHELKTPLASMRALVDTLSAGRYHDEIQLRDYLALIAKENHRLSQLIDNFLTFSRLERGNQHYRFTSLAPESILTAASEALREKFESAQCRLEQHIEPNLPPIRGDADALTTVLVNLLDNACKYTDADKHIRLSVYASGTGRMNGNQARSGVIGHKEAQKSAKNGTAVLAPSGVSLWENGSVKSDAIVFEIADNGIGLSAGAAKKIFERFYQVDQSLTKQRGGCGLGLRLAHKKRRDILSLNPYIAGDESCPESCPPDKATAGRTRKPRRGAPTAQRQAGAHANSAGQNALPAP